MADKIMFVRRLLELASAQAGCNAMKHSVDEVLARKVAVATFADVRTVRRVLRGEPVRGLIGERIRTELERYGSDRRRAPHKSS